MLDQSPVLLAKAEQRLHAEPDDVRRRVHLLEAPGEQADRVTGGVLFDGVLCHGVLMYLPDPEPLLGALAGALARVGGVVMALSAAKLGGPAGARAAQGRRRHGVDATTETGVLGADTRGSTVGSLPSLLRRHGVDPQA